LPCKRHFQAATRVVESEVKCLTPTTTPTFPKFPSPTPELGLVLTAERALCVKRHLQRRVFTIYLLNFFKPAWFLILVSS